jgi:competence protein ComEC
LWESREQAFVSASLTRAAVLAILAILVLLAGCTGGLPASEPTDSPIPSTDTPTNTAGGGPNGTLEVHFINVEQSVSTLIIGPTGETMLIDSGHFNDDGEYVLQYLQRLGIDRIDYFVTSHNDADHIGGNAAVIEYYETEGNGIGAIYDPGIAASTNTFEEYLDAVEQYNVTLYSTREGDSIPFEGIDVQVMGPPEGYIENEARNENSIVLKLTHGQTSFLFTGDAEDDQEAYLVDKYGNELYATVMKAGHHGSKSSTSGAILDAAQPKAVVISSEYDSQYGHPNEETLQRLAERDISTYWTATHGHVVLVSDGQEVRISTQRAAPTEASSIRDGDGINVGSTDPVQQRAVITGDGLTDATPTGTAVVTDGGTDTGTGAQLDLASVNADPEGDDSENLESETVTIENTGDTAVDMSGWIISDAADTSYTVPDGFILDAGATVTLHTGRGTDSATDLYWNRGSSVWNNGGDTVIITNSEGEEVLREDY